MWQPREHVESLGSARDGLGRQCAGDSCQRQSVTAEALQEPDVGRELPEMRRAIHRDVEPAAPAVVDPGGGELRKYAQQARARCAAVTRVGKATVADAPAEQQPVIGGATKVVEYPVHVADRGIVRNQLPGTVLAQRLGGQHVSADAHDRAPQRRRERTQ